MARSAAPAAVSGASNAPALRPGPWGRVTATALRIAPPLDLLREPALVASDRPWCFEDALPGELAELLAPLPLDDQQRQELTSADAWRQSGDTFEFTPSPQLRRTLGPDARRMLYHRLAKDAHNLAHVNAFRFWGTSADQWLAPLEPRLAQLVRPMVYADGPVLFFADASIVMSQIEEPDDRLRLLQVLAAERTLILELHVAPGQDVEPLVAYWGRGRSASSVRTILQSLADRPAGGSIDAVHLLPPFARARLYTYPQPGPAMADGRSRDCHWSALNFFNDHPEDRYADAHIVSQALEQDYTPVESPSLGDLVVLEAGGRIFHSCVYIADNVVFTKNGPRPSRPWMLLPLDAMLRFYPIDQPVRTTFLRRQNRERPLGVSGSISQHDPLDTGHTTQE